MSRLTILAAALIALAPPALAGTVVRAPAGALEGKTDGDIRVFEGIPYAAPPIGAARWAPPQPAATWTGLGAEFCIKNNGTVKGLARFL